jgi:acyl-CoA synthetase (AMP-forming)/AMP-acid ligase II
MSSPPQASRLCAGISIIGVPVNVDTLEEVGQASSLAKSSCAETEQMLRSGYWNRPETEEAFIELDGCFFRSGDLGYYDEGVISSWLIASNAWSDGWINMYITPGYSRGVPYQPPPSSELERQLKLLSLLRRIT